jgi:glyoxylase-like metal-dependent hydrolase (beta-lactamase superfamily II)
LCSNAPQEIKAVHETFPIQVAEDVFYCGYHSDRSFGAASYLIQHPEGNILVDSPRFALPLVKRLKALGGVRYLYLTHRDDVADHQAFHEHFGCERILHRADITPATAAIEHPVEGEDEIAWLSDVTIIPVPGHTAGHTVLLYRDRFLFSGDHLAWSPRLQHLYAFRRQCWYSWSAQIQSMEKLMNFGFEWVLPGHGRRFQADKSSMAQQMAHCVAWMKPQ